MLGPLGILDRPRRRASQTAARVWTVEAGQVGVRRDVLATEEPLAIRLDVGGATQDLTITMRTPGADFELAAGFLFAEGIVRERDEIARIVYCVDPVVTGAQEYNVVTVELRANSPIDLSGLGRRFATTSACGVCGKASLDALTMRGVPRLPAGPMVSDLVVQRLPDRLRDRQRLFAATGGLHAAALFTGDGTLLVAREDVGRHNAVDKVIGWALLDGRLPLHECVVVVSGRAGYEIVQKCVVAGVPVLAAVSAPSSLAVDVAAEFGMTLIGFARGDRFNVYHGFERISVSPTAASPGLD